MRSLIVREGLTKRAAPEDGPSFEQQFGILANAVVVDKFPQLDKMRLAFQLIEKTDDNSSAVGAVVYMIGKSVVFVPAFYKSNKLITGDMMFVAQTNQFMPLSDAWINWLKGKDLSDAGELVDKELSDTYTTPENATIKEINDPIMKHAALELRVALRGSGDPLSREGGINVLDAALCMGKKASEKMLDNLINNRGFLNAALTFYTGDQLDTFAKTAAYIGEHDVTGDTEAIAELILPLDKKAAMLTRAEEIMMRRDGYVIRKRASSGEGATIVIRQNSLDGKFSKVDSIGKFGLLTMDGGVRDTLVLRCERLCPNDVLALETGAHSFAGCHSADDFMERASKGHTGYLVAIGNDNSVSTLPNDVMYMRGSDKAFKPDMLDGVGRLLNESVTDIPCGAKLLTPNGKCYDWSGYGFVGVKYGNGWSNGHAVLTVADDNGMLQNPIITSDAIHMPKGTRILVQKDTDSEPVDSDSDAGENSAKAPVAYVKFSTLPIFLNKFCDRTYHKAKIYSDGSSIIVSGDKTPEDDNKPLTSKEAALKLVCDYNIEPGTAKMMLKDACAKASYDNPVSVKYFIQKTAADLDNPSAADLPMKEVMNKQPEQRSMQMPTQLESPEQLTQAVQTAANEGIKEVFDVTTLKLLVRQSQLFDDIKDDMPLFMKVLDSLCRKLFQYYWHTDKMEEKYGLVKMKSLEASLKVTLDNLSELTMFFKQRTVDGSGITGDVGGDLVNQ